MPTMICDRCFELGQHLDYAGEPDWLRLQRPPIELAGPTGQTMCREDFRCRSSGCLTKWTRVCDSSKPGVWEWTQLAG